jgi:hypothetical protein
VDIRTGGFEDGKIKSFKKMKTNLIIMKIIYKMSHKDFPEFIYIGQTDNLSRRIGEHKKSSKKSNLKLYRFIRENNINFDDIEFEMVAEVFENYTLWEMFFIKEFNSIEKGLNTCNARREFNYKHHFTDEYKYKCKFCEEGFYELNGLVYHTARGLPHMRKMRELNLPRFKH